MSGRAFVSFVAIALLAGSGGAAPVSGQAPAAGGPPPVQRTPWGDPDIQGIWSSDEEAGVPFERPSDVGDREVLEGSELEELLAEREQQRAESAPIVGGITGAGPTHWYENWGRASARTSLVIDPPDGRVPPLTQAAMARQKAQAGRGGSSFGNGPFDSYTDFSLYDRCITRGLPGVMFPGIYNNNSRITQAPGFVAITYEMIHETRVIPIGGSAAPASTSGRWMGEARGRWEGDTLVVETSNFTDRTSYRGSGATLKLVERFTPVPGKGLRYEVTVADPETFTRSWTAALNLAPADALFEYACHEGNYAMTNMLNGARVAERTAESVR